MIPQRWSDQTLAAIGFLRSRPSLAGVTVARTKRPDVLKQVVLDTEPGQLETPVSRRVTVLLESWVTGSDGNADVGESYNLMSTVLHELQCAPSVLTHVVRFDSPVGPRIVKDVGQVEYHEGSLVWVVSR